MSREPAFRITLDGKDLTAAVHQRFVSLTITEKRGEKADQLDIELVDDDGKLAIPKKGAVLTVALGWKGGALVDKGTFKVDETEHSGPPDHITIRARSADFTAELRTRRERSWKDKTVGDVLKDVAAPHGLEVVVAPELAAKPIAIFAQSRESDTHLLARLGKRYDAVATIKAGRLLFAPIGSGKTAKGAALPAAITVTRSDGDTHSWKSADRDSHYTGVSASWHDKGSASRHRHRAGAAGKVKHLKRVYASEAEAKQAANAEAQRIKRVKSTMSFALAYGRPELYPERKVTLKGWKPEIDQTYLIESATHTLSDQGLCTSLELEQS